MNKHSSPELFEQATYTDDLYEYLLIVQPAKKVYDQVVEEKQQFYNLYKEKIAIVTKPHITVANFLATDMMEETIIRYMHRIIGALQCFDVTLNNFSGFPTSNTIYLRVQEEAPFKQMAQQLKVVDQYIKSSGQSKAHLISKPHVTIARRLSADVFEKSLLHYAQKTFHASFTVQELVLIKHRGTYDAYKPVCVFKLSPPASNAA
jgi:2'-5' RNA ligase